MTRRAVYLLAGGAALFAAAIAYGQFGPIGIQPLTNREMLLRLSAPTGVTFRIDRTTNLLGWNGLLTLTSTGNNQHADSGAPYRQAGVYRAFELGVTNALTGDHLNTTNGDVTIHPIRHASFVMSWNGLIIYNDPDSPTNLYTGLPKADLILVSHDHGDHFDTAALDVLRTNTTIIIAPQAVYNSMGAPLRALTGILTNNMTTNLLGLRIDAIPAYNANHPLGRGNGYVVTIGGRRIYMSGDTGDIPETRALPEIDVAFLCMNLPFTMSVTQAVGVVRQFRPRVVYPYHFQNMGGTFGDLNYFKRQVGTDVGVEVRIRKWY
ncbi:MAG: MBL fold metallo-hydrolase [Verrucomicrobia subdivision 3 bacterium]|nr:MBL fold metallo-hydrolase [Limisphaerales bacterium]